MSAVWKILKSAVRGYIANEALSRGAAISFYAVTSLTPFLLKPALQQLSSEW